jgi:YD repeat-containing protein
LHELVLSGNPVQSVLPSSTGTAFEYRKRDRRLRVNAAGIGELLTRSSSDAETLRVLTAAAVSEVNRALTEVTDTEERRALLALLKEL